MLLMAKVVFSHTRLAQQPVVQCPSLRCQRHAALLYFPKARRVRAAGVTGEGNGFFQGFKAGLAQQQRHRATRRPFDHRFRFDAVFRHQRLYLVNIQGTRRQMVNMTAGKTHHIGNQPMLLMQRLIRFFIDRRVVMPAKGFQRFTDKFLPLCRGQATLLVVKGHQRPTARREDIASGKNTRRFVTQRRVVNQLQTQQRGKNTKRITLERRVINRTKSGGVHRHARHGKIVIPHRVHPHDGKHAAQRRQLLRRSHPDSPVTLHVQARQFIGVGQLFM